MPGGAVGGRAAAWQASCRAALTVNISDSREAREFFERFFQPHAVTAANENTGIFTGYYEPLLMGDTKPSARFNVPLYARPSDLISVDLGRFRPSMKGERIAGRVEGTKLIPFADRKAIDNGALADRALEVLWVDDAVMVFSLQIQGSGRVELPDGKQLRVGYAGQNGHQYVAIGRRMVAEGYIDQADISMHSIRAWLYDNPDEASRIMQMNPSYVFFRHIDDMATYGAAGVALTARRSLAVDPKYIPYHAPIWLSSSHPNPASRSAEPIPLAKLMVAQDRGGAIKGEIRGDVFWGFGPEAKEIAGRMANKGSYFLLLPKEINLDEANR